MHWMFCYNSILDLSSYVFTFYKDVPIKSCSLPFLPNLYCTSIKRPTSILGDHFSKPRGRLRNRGGTLDVSFGAETDVLLVLKRKRS